jgi:hypothetical protein
MESALCRTVTPSGFQPTIKLVVLNKPATSEDDKYQKFLNELQSYGCGYWKWLRKRRIREVFVVGSVTNPETGKIDKIRIKKKSAGFIELTDCRRFDIKTGRCLSGEPRYIFSIENRLVWNSWEPQSLRQRVERALPALPFKAARAYADLLHPNWHLGIFTEKLDRVLGRNFDRPAASLSEREEASMASCRKFAKETVLDHLPGAIQEFRALVEMMEGDAK